MRFIKVLLATTIVAFSSLSVLTAQELTIGSVAPELDIEHWVQDGEGKFKPVTKFQKGHVYIVEFWTTWCPPCVRSMPHLAALQQKYADKNVQIIGISDETLDEVTQFLERPSPEGGKTFGEVTRAYCLTTDPDRSSHDAYLKAAGQDTIPVSFIVGRDGHIEWIGNPLVNMDEPLASVVAGTWDRVKFLTAFKRKQEIETTINEIQVIAGSGNFPQAIEKIDDLLKDPLIKTDEFMGAKQHIEMLRPIFVVINGGKEGLELLKKQAAEAGDDWAKNGQVALNVYQAFQMNPSMSGDAAKQYVAIGFEAAEKTVAAKPNNIQLLEPYAFLLHRTGNIDKAIEVQSKFVDAVRGRMKLSAEKFLTQLKREKAEAESGK